VIIRKMTATFGNLNRAVLEPSSGLTVIHAPNEGGKSTWAGFLRAMLYGINTRERDKEGFLADKNRYAPWSGAPMEGELQLNWKGEEITLRRFTKRTPFGGFEAVYTASGDSVPGLTADNVGETLIGAGREMFERSAFVGQGNTALVGGPELERRIAALAAGGEEEVSFTQTQRILKDWLNRRRANRSNGLLPELDGEMLRLREELSSLGQAKEEERNASARLETLEKERRELVAELEIHKRIAQQELDRRYGAARQEWERACADLEQVGEHPLFGTMTAREAWEYAQTKAEAQKAAEEENRRLEEQRAELEEKQSRLRAQTVLWAVLTVIWLVAIGASLWLGKWFSTFLLGCAAVSSGANWLRLRKLAARTEEKLGELIFVEIPHAGDILEQAAAYRERLARASQATLACAAAKKLMDELAAQGGREFTTLEYLHPPVRSMAETAARLRWVEEEIARCRRGLDMLRGRMGTMGDEAALAAKLEELSARRADRRREYDALTVAMEVLSNANDTLRQRFSPALNRAASKLFARMTGGEYSDLGLARSFEATATPEGELLPRSALALSRGTVEQLYLAVRLAVCDLTLGGDDPAPLILDDALVNFDDERMALALDLLRGLGGERQILLFSCHSREAAWAEKHGVPVYRLQSTQG